MCPSRVAEYVRSNFGGPESAIKISILEDADQIREQYPLLAAVNRCANVVEEHRVGQK